ncbi:hypothetical protein JNG39_08465 [Luteibacter sp. CQ10]
MAEGVEASAHELLNEATEWLQYARGMTQLLAEWVEEVEVVDRGKMVLALGAIEAMTSHGVACAAQAHVRVLGAG